MSAGVAEVDKDGVRLSATTWAGVPARARRSGRRAARTLASPAPRARSILSRGLLKRSRAPEHSDEPSPATVEEASAARRRAQQGPARPRRRSPSPAPSACSRWPATCSRSRPPRPTSTSSSRPTRAQSSVIFAADGSRLGYVQSDEIRTPDPVERHPDGAPRAPTVAIEDERFYEHEGVDYEAIVRAGVKNLESGENVQGGSTITQQLVRALYIKDPQRNFTAQDPRGQAGLGARGRALQDLDPPQLPERRPVRHRRRAHRDRRSRPPRTTFFSKHARTSTLPEAALLAGLPQAPSQYNPFRNPTRRPRAPQRGARADGRERLHHARRGRRGRARARSA